MTQDPQAMARGVMAIQRQAQAWVEQYRGELAAAGLGFDDDDLAAVEASRTTHTVPAGREGGFAAQDQDDAAAMAAKAMAAVYPEDGFAPDDPRLVPVGSVTLVALAVAARAIGWDTDPALTARVVRALGLDPSTWEASSEALRTRVTDDIAVATLYGQLFNAADPLPRRAT